jgi:hypothetical protein
LKEEKTMKKKVSVGGVLASLFLMVALIVTQATAAEKAVGATSKATEMKPAASGPVYVMSGKLQGVYPQWGTAVINCPEGKQTFTVAGPFAPKAKLSIGGKPEQMKDFKTGENVTVKWEAVPEGHLILMLSAK